MEILSFATYEKLQKAALLLPEAYEKECHRTPAFYVGKKLFVRLKEDGETIALYNSDRDEWMARNGDLFFITDHYKNHPMLLADLKRIASEDLKTLLQISWKLRAPKNLLKQYSSNAID